MAILLKYNGLGGKLRFRGASTGGFKARYVASTSALLLDLYPGAAAAYSLRKLSSTYNGSAIRVRRSSDNTEQDIGFVSNTLDTASLLSFCGVGNGFVTTWYDQSGNTKNAIQITTANQPTIVSSGVITLFGSKPSLYFSNSSFYIPDTGLTISNPSTYFNVSEGTSTNNTGYRTLNDGYFVTGPNRQSFGKTDTNVYYLYAGSLVTSATTYSITKSLMTAVFNAASSYLYRNQIALISNQNAGSTNQLGLFLGASSLTQNLFEGYIPEHIIYSSNQTSNRTAIESNINSYYQIYWSGTGTALLDLYPSATVAYSLRNLSSTYKGPLVRVRRSSDNAELDIYGLYNGQLDTSTLLSFCGAGSGFVTTWYDQSGNTTNVTQATAAYQPRIVASGTIYLFGSRPTLYFSSNALSNSAINLTQPNTYFIVTQGTATNLTGDRNIFDGIQVNGRNAIGKSSGNSNYFMYANALVYSSTPVNTNKSLFVPIFPSPSFASLYLNGTAILSNANPGPQSLQGLRIGGYTDTAAMWESYMPEYIIYNSDQSTNRTAIESNINSYYTIY